MRERLTEDGDEGLAPDAGQRDRLFVTALARGLQVLRSFRSGEERLGNQELAERCGLPKTTVSRLTYTLTRLGYLHHVEESGRYRLGLTTLALGGSTLRQLDVKEISRPLMQRLADETGVLVALGMRDQLSMLYIEACRGDSMLTLRLGIGSRTPLATTAMGRAWLAGARDDVRRRLQARIRAVDEAAWPDVLEGIRQALADLSIHGCVTSFGDWRPEIHAIAVPLLLGRGLPLVSLTVAGPAIVLPPEHLMNEVRPRLLATARAIRAEFGLAD